MNQRSRFDNLSAVKRAQRGLELTPQQRAVLRLVSYGFTAQQSAKTLHDISENTIKRHLRNVYWRLDARNGVHAVRLGFERRILHVRDTVGIDAGDLTRRARLGSVTTQETNEIRGFNTLTPRQLELINKIKETEEHVAQLWQQLADELPNGHDNWLTLGRVRLQEGFMALVRAIARPHDPFEDSML